MTASYLPGMGTLSLLSEWIETQEELISSSVLLNPESDLRSPSLCAVFLSRNGRGDYLLRCCEGADDSFMIWREQRRMQPLFGEAYAVSQLNLWLQRREDAGYRVEWNAQRTLGVDYAAANAA